VHEPEIGVKAADAGDYATALREWLPLAEKGDSSARYNLGVMHNNGYGVHQYNAEALKWYRLAAEQGHANAQYNLGFMYANGKGVLEDFAEALKWYRLSAELLVNYCGCPNFPIQNFP
jgi:TPR repeat protein